MSVKPNKRYPLRVPSNIREIPGFVKMANPGISFFWSTLGPLGLNTKIVADENVLPE